MSRKNLIVVLTIIVSAIFLVIANRITSSNMIRVDHDNVVTFQRVTVEDIVRDDGFGDVFFTFYDQDGNLQTAGMSENLVDSLGRVSPGQRIVVNHGTMIFASEGVDYAFFDYVRIPNFIKIVFVFLLAVVLYGRKKGLLSVIALLLTLAALFFVFLPSVLSRMNVYVWLMITCLFIIASTLLIIYGPSKKSLSAGIGIVIGLIMTIILMFITERFLHITGFGNDDLFFINASLPEHPLDMIGVMFALIILGSLGAIMDVGISIASAVSELKEANPNASFIQLMKSGNNIGRDINGTMVNTLVLAFIGASFISMITLITFQNDMWVVINRENFIINLFQPLVGSFGILLTLPITAAVSAYVYTHLKSSEN